MFCEVEEVWFMALIPKWKVKESYSVTAVVSMLERKGNNGIRILVFNFDCPLVVLQLLYICR